MAQYNAALAITGAMRGTTKEKLYQELRFESLQQSGKEDFAIFIKYSRNNSQITSSDLYSSRKQ